MLRGMFSSISGYFLLDASSPLPHALAVIAVTASVPGATIVLNGEPAVWGILPSSRHQAVPAATCCQVWRDLGMRHMRGCGLEKWGHHTNKNEYKLQGGVCLVRGAPGKGTGFLTGMRYLASSWEHPAVTHRLTPAGRRMGLFAGDS